MQNYIFIWTDIIRQKYDLPSEFIILNNKKFVLGIADLPEKTISLATDEFIHDTISFEDQFICRCKFIQQEPFEAQLQIYITKETVVLGILFCDLQLPAPAPEDKFILEESESKLLPASSLLENEPLPDLKETTELLMSIMNLVYYRFDKRQISYFKENELLYEFFGTQLHITKHCPPIIFDYGKVEYSTPMIMVLPPNTQQNSLYAAIHPSENLNRKYSLPTTFEIQPKNILRYMLDSDFRELYKQWFSPTKKCDICYPKNQQIQPPVHMILCPNCVSRLATKLQTIQSIDVINSTNNKKN